MKLFIDIETYSEEDIRKTGAYRYLEHSSMEILMVAYAFNDEPVEIVDLAMGEELPDRFIAALHNSDCEKHAHNAMFERTAFKHYGYDIPVNQWYCTAIKAGYCGWPLSLGGISKAMELGELGKDAKGKALIKYFCCPCKPTKTNGGRLRNYYHHNMEKWDLFKAYCIQDVEAERVIDNRLEKYKIPTFERENYILDQEINDRGLLIDLVMAQGAIDIHREYTDELKDRLKVITELENPNSAAQLKKWLEETLGTPIASLAKDKLGPLIKSVSDPLVLEALSLRKELSKTSIKKYDAMLRSHCSDERARGLLQFYGANRTGRWAGRLIQIQNLPRNYISFLEEARECTREGSYPVFDMMYSDISNNLSQLIRTAFIAGEGNTFVVADFSAIEARVIAWIADEQWRLDVFNSHGKIYEASAAMMFDVPFESVTKGSDLRQRGKVAELALGYQGSVGAMKNMGGEKMGLSEEQMKVIVDKWREKSAMIVQLWKNLDAYCKLALRNKGHVFETNRLRFKYDGYCLRIRLPSGRSLFYVEPSFTENRWGHTCVQYKGINQVNNQWCDIQTYGGKLAENVVQAIARDLLAESMLALNKEGFKIVMHVHDEAIAVVPVKLAETALSKMCEIMGRPIPWADGLPLVADGYITPFYKKD